MSATRSINAGRMEFAVDLLQVLNDVDLTDEAKVWAVTEMAQVELGQPIPFKA